MWKLLLVVLLAAAIQAKNTKRNYPQAESYTHEKEYAPAPEYPPYEVHKGFGLFGLNRLKDLFGSRLENLTEFGISILLLGMLALIVTNIFNLPPVEITARNLHLDDIQTEIFERLEEIYNRFKDA